MSVRKKLNGLYVGGCAVFGAAAGLVFTSWTAAAVAFAAAAITQIMAGNIRFANSHR